MHLSLLVTKLQLMLHTSTGCRTLARQSERYRPEMAQFFQAATSQLSMTLRCSRHNSDASRGPNTHVNLFSLLRASHAHHPQLRKRHTLEWIRNILPSMPKRLTRFKERHHPLLGLAAPQGYRIPLPMAASVVKEIDLDLPHNGVEFDRTRPH